MKRTIDLPFFKQVQDDIDRADRKADRYRNIFYFMRIALIVIAGIITVVSGFKESPEEISLRITLILGAIITALTSIDTLFQIETKKNTYKLILVELREIRSELIYHHDNTTPEKLRERIDNHLFPKYQSVMAYSKTLLEKESK